MMAKIHFRIRHSRLRTLRHSDLLSAKALAKSNVGMTVEGGLSLRGMK